MKYSLPKSQHLGVNQHLGAACFLHHFFSFCIIVSPKKGKFGKSQSYKTDFGIIYIKNGVNKLNFTLNYINFDVVYAKKVI